MATTADVALVDAALKELEVHCGLGLDPSVKLRDDQAILIHNAACKLGEACTQHVLEHTSPVRVQLLEKIHVPKRLGGVCRILLQHKELRTLGGTLLGPLISLGAMIPSQARGGSFEILFSTQLAKSGLLAEIPGIISFAVQRLEAATTSGAPLLVDVITPHALHNSSSGRRSGGSGGASSSSGGGSQLTGQINSYVAGQHEVAFLGLVSNLLQFIECIHAVWPGNLLQSPDAGPIFKPATQLAVATIAYSNTQLQQLAEKGQVPSVVQYRAVYSAFRLCPCLCSVLAKHGTRVGEVVTVLPAAAELMAAPSFRQCALLYMSLQAQTQLVAPLYGWLSPAEKAINQARPGNSSSSSRASSSRRASSSAAAAARRNTSSSSSSQRRGSGSSSSSGAAAARRRSAHAGRGGSGGSCGPLPVDATVEGVPLKAWILALEQQQPALTPAHEQLLTLLGVSRLLLLWLGMQICMDASQPSLQHAILQQTLLVEVLDVYRSCWQMQPGERSPGRQEIEQLQLLPNMLLEWVNGLTMPTDSEDYIFCATGAAFCSRFALRTWMVHRFFGAGSSIKPAAAAAEPAAGAANGTSSLAAAGDGGTDSSGDEQQLDAGADLPDDECFDELVPDIAKLLGRLLPYVLSGTEHTGPQLQHNSISTSLAPPAMDPRAGVPAQAHSRSAAEAFRQTLEVTNWIASTNPRQSDNWAAAASGLGVPLQAFLRSEAAGPAWTRVTLLLGALRGLYVHDLVPRGLSSYVVSGPLLQHTMAAGAGALPQAHLHSILITGLKLSSSCLPEQPFAYLEAVSSVAAAAQAVLCTLYEDALSAAKAGDSGKAEAGAAAILPWLFILGRSVKYLAVLLNLLLQSKLREGTVGNTGTGQTLPMVSPENTCLWLYLNAVSLCTRLLHLCLTLLSPMAVDVSETVERGQEQLSGEQVAAQQRQQQQYLRQLSAGKRPGQCSSSGSQQQQEQQDVSQHVMDQEPAAPAGCEGSSGATAAAAAGSSKRQQQQQQQQQQADQQLVPSGQKQQQRPGETRLNSEAAGSVRQMVWEACASVGVDITSMVEVVEKGYSAALAADAAMQKHFDPAVLLGLTGTVPGAPMIEIKQSAAAAAAAAAAGATGSSGSTSSSSSGGSDSSSVAVPVAVEGDEDGALEALIGASSSRAAMLLGGVVTAIPNSSSSTQPSLAAVAAAPAVVTEAEATRFCEDPAVAAVVTALHAAGTALGAVPTSMACNNPSCPSLAKEAEQLMVNGRGCLCGGCKLARYCGKSCQNAHWKTHRPVCKAVSRQQQEGEGQQ